METAKETKFGTKVACGTRMMPKLPKSCTACRKHAIPHLMMKNNRKIIECCNNTHQGAAHTGKQMCTCASDLGDASRITYVINAFLFDSAHTLIYSLRSGLLRGHICSPHTQTQSTIEVLTQCIVKVQNLTMNFEVKGKNKQLTFDVLLHNCELEIQLKVSLHLLVMILNYLAVL